MGLRGYLRIAAVMIGQAIDIETGKWNLVESESLFKS
jgi:hypothetical protein